MGKQSGVIQIEGTVGNISFFKTKDGYFVRKKAGIDGKRIATDPAFARTRENLSEFGRAGKAGKLIRLALAAAIRQIDAGKLANRLTQELMRVIKTDMASPRGMRNVADGEVALLQGFEFNPASPLGTTLSAPYTAQIDRAAGSMVVDFAPFVPMNAIESPEGATHCLLHAAGAELDFVNSRHTGAAISSSQIPLNGVLTEPLQLTVPVPAASTLPLMLAVGITFLQEVNGTAYPLKNSAFNALALVQVSSPE